MSHLISRSPSHYVESRLTPDPVCFCMQQKGGTNFSFLFPVLERGGPFPSFSSRGRRSNAAISSWDGNIKELSVAMPQPDEGETPL